MFNFKIDPTTKAVETSTDMDYSSVTVPNMPLTQSNVNGNFHANAPYKASSNELDEAIDMLKEKKDKKKEEQDKTTSVKDTTKEDVATEEQSKTLNTKEPAKEKKEGKEDVNSIKVKAENEDVIDDFGEGDID